MRVLQRHRSATKVCCEVRNPADNISDFKTNDMHHLIALFSMFEVAPNSTKAQKEVEPPPRPQQSIPIKP
jgi:hypothetical protein